MANKEQYIKDLIRNRKHEKSVKEFFKNVGVSEQFIHYDNFKTFANAKNTMKFKTVTFQDVKVLNKFCKRWIQLKGQVEPDYLRRIQSKIKYYSHKQQNSALRHARLQRRKLLKLN
jgi:3-mercaptopyruvate sulfurtransferase SseA